ncbi:MAG: aspartate kinase [Bacteroidia bacterium]|nr:aspartate kinase [Bacteroidia bacterium]
MKVFKFGGASVKGAEGIKNLAKIVSQEKENLVIVVSAFGKTTNALEKVLKLWLAGEKSYKEHLENIYSYHSGVVEELFPSGNSVGNKIDKSFTKLKEYLQSEKKSEYDFEYDQVVSFGEIWSTIIIAGYLRKTGLNAEWIDIRKNLLTDNRYRDANVLWSESTDRIKAVFDFKKTPLYLTQGFIGGTADGNSTTLGREGSDYTAAILANMLDAECVIFWKDVPGLLNADPKWLNDACKLEEMSYREAVEMTFSGAKVIHPKTIKPLQNKNIPLFVKSFLAPDEKGTMVIAEPTLKKIISVFIKKENQILISILPKDFSFVMSDNLSRIFHTFIMHGIKVNLVEASAVSIDVCVDDERPKVESLLIDLKAEYSAFYNENVEMLSIRHYTPEAIARITADREILLEQRTRSAVRFVVRGIASLRSQ